jgi:hypothetical protein
MRVRIKAEAVIIPRPQVVDHLRLQRWTRTGWTWRKTFPKTKVERVRSVVGGPERKRLS